MTDRLRRRVAGLGRPARLALFSAVTSGALLLATYAASPGDSRAAEPPKPPTILQMELPVEVDLGTHPDVHVRLTSGGVPAAGQLVSVEIGGRVSLQLTTGADGGAAGEIARDFPAGRYEVKATFAGSPAYRSSASPPVVLVVQPSELTIATVPPIPDLPLVRVAGGAVLTTDADGLVRVTMTTVGNVELQLALPPDGSRRVQLERWDDGSTELLRTIRVPTTSRVTVGLQVLYPIRFEFSAFDGTPIDEADVPLVRIADGAGAEQVLIGPAPYWLRANDITRVADELVSTAVEYRIVSIPLAGADVVNRGQQRIVADEAKTVEVRLLIFQLTLQGRDALLKTTSGSSVTITSAGGASQVVDLDDEGRGSIRLPRGVYRLVLGGSLGIPLSTPVALSRDQEVDILLVSVLDIALAVALSLVLAVGLIVIGRPHVLRRRKPGPRKPDDADPPEPSWPASPPSVPRVRSGP